MLILVENTKIWKTNKYIYIYVYERLNLLVNLKWSARIKLHNVLFDEKEENLSAFINLSMPYHIKSFGEKRIQLRKSLEFFLNICTC